MIRSILMAFGLLLLVPVAPAQTSAAAGKSATSRTAGTPSEEKHRDEDIATHRQMARAHEEAAKCLESGEKESVCHERLRAACKGIAVGRYCGMRHGH
jgi:hypothetical protein